MKNFFSHSYSSKFSFFAPDHNILFTDSPNESVDFGTQPNPDTISQSLRATKALTVGILATFTKCNPNFAYNQVQNPKRCLTFPPEGVYNDGHDNINNEYILYVSDVIKSPENHEYVVLELLGKGTFGQVVKCLRKGTNEEYALKVIKNKPAYTSQALSEIKIYRKIKEDNERNENYVVRLYDYFVFRNHICLLMEMLHISLYDLLEMSKFSGFSLRFTARLTQQILEGMACLEKNKIIHCDLKPENILFADDKSDVVKLIDLGSSCFIHNTLYTYIQSRFYRAPEVILGMKYTNKIDSWSLGCIAAEFYLGLPIFPGSSEYEQLKRIIEVVGMPEPNVLELGRFKNKFFNRVGDSFVLKTVEEYQQEQNIILPPYKKYFILNRLEDLDMYYSKSKQREKNPQDRQNMSCFVHFLSGLLTLDPMKRWSASQALRHPFITNEPFTSDWQPPVYEQALGIFENELATKEFEVPDIQSTFLGFSMTSPTESLNPESYRPFVPPSHTDKKEEVISQSQNVYLLNNQANSTKPKSKLNPKASAFTNTFQVPALNPDALNGKGDQSNSYSEPNSARSVDYKPKNAYGKNKGKSNYSNNNYYSNSAKGKQGYNNNDNDGSWGQNKREQRKSQQYYPNQFGYNNTQYNDFSQDKFASDSESQGNFRQRSNSDHDANGNIYFNNKPNKRKYGNRNGGNKPEGHNINQNTQINPINPQELRNQPTPDTAETSNSSNELEFKNKFSGTGHNKPSQQDEAKEEYKEEELL